jgi:hypothetical protein
MQPGVMRAQKLKIQISRVKNPICSEKNYSFSSFYMELEVFFTIILKLVISFMKH